MKEKANLEYIDKLAGDDQEFRTQFIAILREEFPGELEEYKNNIQKRAFRNASENVHKIKHKLNVLGLHESHSLAVKHEAELRNQTCTLDHEFMSVLAYVASYLKTI